MKYRMYHWKNITGILLTLMLGACASTKPVVDAETTEAEAREIASTDDSTIREPASMVGNVDWLNDVQDDFSRIAEETSNRAVASRKADILVLRNRWTFQYTPSSNQFGLKLDGTNYSMIQTSLEDKNNFSFAAEGQTETPITLIVAQNNASREVAEADSMCVVELNFWDTKNKKYQKDIANIHGSRCVAVMNQLRSYVP